MRKYNCTICGAGCYSADETKTICAECVKDGNMVEVVRCGDCVFLNNRGGLWCGFHDSLYPTTKDYCSWGVRGAK